MTNTLPLSVSVCVPAYNEGKNLHKILTALVAQETERIHINKIVVVSSGSTDETDDIGRMYAKDYPQVEFIRENERKGKASAINTFLKVVNDPVVVIESADTVPQGNTIENLCAPFIDDEKLGMTGGAPHPVNDQNTFLGYIIHVWWWFHRKIPRFGEIIAYRNILPQISPTTSVDEAYIQAKIIQLGYDARHVDTAVVHNKGPETVADLIKQRRRVLNGHARLFNDEKVKIDNMTTSSFKLLFQFKHPSAKHSLWFFGGLVIEAWSRVLGHYDVLVRKINPFIWDTAKTTKNLDINTNE